MSVLEHELASEVQRQDDLHGTAFAGDTPYGRVRLGIACLEDEVRETLDAWRQDRRMLEWRHTREEALQVAALAMRLVRQIDHEAELERIR